MDATTQTAPPATRLVPAKGPRPRTDYRAVRRNAAKTARMLLEWRETVAEAANIKANIHIRADQANGAREAAAKALAIDNVMHMGLRRDVMVAFAMLKFYRAERRTRSITRIIRGLEKHVQDAR